MGAPAPKTNNAKPAAAAVKPPVGKVWWENAIFFILVHIATAVGAYYYPIWEVPHATLALIFVLWHVAMFGVTIGYHRLFSHNSFKTGPVVKFLLTLAGASAFQGSAKWWAVRHRLHHRWTDDPIHDPYAATRGMLWAHVGWIFFKPNYERIALIDKTDLDNDKVVRIQHKFYVPFAFFMAFGFPVLVGSLWNDTMNAFIWAALFKAVIVWHCTFAINSLAHWEGLQPYSDQNTSKSNFFFAMLTAGEGNHNFHHSFPQDFRSTPETLNWDPSKWVILILYKLGFVSNLRTVTDSEIEEAKVYMNGKHHHHGHHHAAEKEPEEKQVNTVEFPKHPTWTLEEARAFAAAKAGRCILVLDGCVLDATTYMGDHPGGAKILRQYSLRATQNGDEKDELWKEGQVAFYGGLNTHTLAAVRQMKTMIVAKLVDC